MKISYLDLVLAKLIEVCDKSHQFVQPEEIHKELNTKFSVLKTRAALDKISKDGYVEKSYLKTKGIPIENSPTYYVNFDGLYFNSTSSYVRKRWLERISFYSRIAKFVITVFAALCLMATTYFSYDAYKINHLNDAIRLDSKSRNQSIERIEQEREPGARTTRSERNDLILHAPDSLH